MPEMRKDPLTGAWVVLSPERKLRPHYYLTDGQNQLPSEECPFCEGNESMTPPEVYALREDHSHANQPGWQLRVVPNKFPALRVEGDLGKRGEGFYDKMNGIGAHEVVIESPDHSISIDKMSRDAVSVLFRTIKHRILDLEQDKRIKYIQVFKNHGAKAGATIPHPHCQIIALPVVPDAVAKRLSRAEEHFKQKDRCIFCDVVEHEMENRKRILFENGDYLVLAPFASAFPFSLAIYPRHHNASFETTDESLLMPLAEIIMKTTACMNNTLETPAYNLILHNVPFQANANDYFHWHLELIPILSGTGGFELATGSTINAIPPEEAIKILKG